EQVLPGRENIWQLPHASDEGVIAARVIRKLCIASDRKHVAGNAAKTYRVSVRRRFRHRIRPQHSASPSPVLDNKRLSGELAHLLAENARERIGCSPRREAVDVAHRPGRPRLWRE